MQIPFDTRLAQVAIVVSDIEQAVARYASLLGMEPPPVFTTKPGDQVGLEYRGNPGSARAKLAFFDLGGTQLELIEPVGEPSAWADGLPGESQVHHLAFWTQDMAKGVAHVEEHGAPLVMKGDFDDGSGEYAYFDGRKDFGCFIELLARKGK